MHDVVIIGAGVVGSALARELSRFDLNCLWIEAGPDVGAGTSKANTAILHTGFDAPPGSLESRLVTRGYGLLQRYAGETGIALEPTGACLVAWNEEQRAELPGIRAKAQKNGVTDLEPLSADTLYELEPNLGKGALAGLKVPGESIVCPYSPVLAYATQAILNGVKLVLSSPVTSVTREASGYRLRAGDRDVHARWVINAAGLHSDQVDRMFGHNRFTVRPRKGELIVFDKLSRPLLRHILLPVPTATTKGVLVSPTVFGNVLLGPTAEDLEDKRDTTTSESGLAALWQKGRAILPGLLEEEVTATYAGLRAATEHSDYQLHVEAAARYVCVGGIRSTGLTASLAIAEHVANALAEAGLDLRPKERFVPVRVPPLGRLQARPFESAETIAGNPDYGRLVCHCERVSRGELLDALRAPVPARNLDGLRRRTRCLQGRCQGFYCLPQISALFAEQTGIPISSLLSGEVRP